MDSMTGMSLYCTQILHAKLGSFGEEEKNAFFGSPLTTFADTKDGNFSVKPHETLKASRGWGGNVCVFLNLFLRNCTFYCKKTKKDYLTHLSY